MSNDLKTARYEHIVESKRSSLASTQAQLKVKKVALGRSKGTDVQSVPQVKATAYANTSRKMLNARNFQEFGR